MKRSIFTFMFITVAIFVNAQKSYKTTLTDLVKHSQTDFVHITGEKINEFDEGLILYDSKIKLGIGSEAIERYANDPTFFAYNLSAIYSKDKKIRELEKAVNEFIKTNFPASRYNISRKKESNPDNYIIRVYRKKKLYPVLEAALIDNENQKIYSLTLNGKSTQ